MGEKAEAVAKKIICPYCGVGCNIEALVENGRATKTVASGRNPEVNGRYICIKGASVHELWHHPDRLKRPLLRTDGGFEEITWDKATAYVAKRLQEVITKYGPDSVGILCSGKMLNEEDYLLQKFARVVVGTNNIDSCARLCHSPSEAAMKRMLGYGAVSIWWPDLKQAEAVMVVGENPKYTHPVLWNTLIARKEEFDLIVADPCLTEIAQKAQVRIQPKPGTDILWLGGLGRIIYENNLCDWKFINENTIGVDAYIHSLDNYTPELVEEISGVRWSELEEIAAIITKKRTVFIWGMGLTQHTFGTENVMALVNIALMTGNLVREGAGVAPLRGQNNVQGAVDMGAIPDGLPGHFRVNDQGARNHFWGIWGKDVPETPGLSATEMFHAIQSGRIRAMYVVGENPVLSEPQSLYIRWAISKLEFFAVQEIFLTETAKLADVVLPAAMIGEKKGIVTNAARRMQYTDKAVDPPGEAKPDWWIINEIARKMGFEFGYKAVEDIWNEVRRAAPIFSGVTHERLKDSIGLFWPIYSTTHPGTPRLYTDGFAFRDRRARFHPLADPTKITFSAASEEYPFILITKRLYQHFNTGEMTRRSKLLSAAVNSAVASMNPDDAREMDIKSGDTIRITSPYVSITIEATTESKEYPPRGCIFVPTHFFNRINVNALIPSQPLDPYAKIPPLKGVGVKIEKVG